MKESYRQLEFTAQPELTIRPQNAYSGDQRTIMPEGTSIEGGQSSVHETKFVPAIPIEQRRGGEYPSKDAIEMIRMFQLALANKKGDALGEAPKSENWDKMVKNFSPEELKEAENFLHLLGFNFENVDIRDRVLPQFEDPHPDDPFRASAEKQREKYEKERKQRIERGDIKKETVLSQRSGKYLEEVPSGELEALQPRDDAYAQAESANPAIKADAQRQLDAYKRLKNLLLEVKGKEDGNLPIGIRDLSDYLNEIMGLRGQSLGILDDRIQDIVQAFSLRAREAIQEYYTENIERGMYGERKLTQEDIALIKNPFGDPQKIDRLFNRIFEKADIDQSQEFTEALESAGRQEWTDFKNAMNDSLKIEQNSSLQDETIIAYLQENGTPDPTRNQIIEVRKERIKILQKRLLQYSAEHDVRETTHNANYVVLTGAGIQEMQKYTARFRNSYADLAFRKRGVMEAYRYYNQALLRIKSKYGGYLPQSAMIVNPGTGKKLSEVDELAYAMFKDALSKGVVRDPGTYQALSYFESVGGGDPTEPTQMADWEIDRAFGMARGLGIMMGTTIEVAAQSIIPPENTIVSLYARPIVEKLQIFQTIQKYDIGGAKNALFAMFLDKDKRWTRDEFQEFYDMMHHEDPRALAIMNGLIEEEYDRLSRKFNVFGLGGIVSRTAWRAGNDPVAGALGALTETDLDWVGAGLLIEKNRGNLNKHGHEAQVASETISRQLTKMKELQPLILYQKMPKIQDAVLRSLFRAELTDLGILHLDNRKEFEREYHSTYLNEGVIQSALKSEERYKQGGEYTQRVDRLIKRIDDLVIGLSIRQDAALKRRDGRIEDTQQDKTVDKRIYDLPRTPGRIETTTFTGMGPMTIEEQAFVTAAREAFDVTEYVEVLKEKGYRQPYILDVTGMDMQEIFWQVPGEDTMARRWGDHSAAENGAAAVTEFMKGLSHYHAPEDLIEPLEKIYTAVSDYDAGFATQLVMDLTEAAAKFYSKDWYYRLPGFIGGTLGLTKGWKEGTSFAQAVMGQEAMSWDEVDVDKLLKGIRKVKLLTGEKVFEVRQKTLAKKGKVVAAYARFIIPVLAAGALFYIMKESLSDQV